MVVCIHDLMIKNGTVYSPHTDSVYPRVEVKLELPAIFEVHNFWEPA